MADHLKPVEHLIGPAVAETLRSLQLSPEDAGAARLASLYALQIDLDPYRMDSLGPKLLAALEALGATPRARAAISKGPATAGTKLEAFRERRRA